MSWLAFDIGGANLKIADGAGYAVSQSFPLWKQKQELADKLSQLLADAPPADRIAITMTGELCDCFATKSEGVAAILDAAQEACSGRELFVYLTDGRLASIEDARANPLAAAASNWLALATFACRFCTDTALLIDVGSTTTDAVWLSSGGPLVQGRTDTERLATGELCYQGVDRTPLCVYADRGLQLDERRYPLAAEFFATMADVHLLLHDLDEEPENHDTADGRPRIIDHARARIARMICMDPSEFTLGDATNCAEQFAQWQLRTIQSAIDRVMQPRNGFPRLTILSGQGEFVGRRLFNNWGGRLTLSLNSQLGPLVSRCAPAHALAVLAREYFEAVERPRP